MELLDPYTENFAEVGSVGHPPGQLRDRRARLARPAAPRACGLIRAPYDRVWVIGRTYIRNAADTPNVVRIQNQYGLTPLEPLGHRATARRGRATSSPVRRSTRFPAPRRARSARLLRRARRRAAALPAAGRATGRCSPQLAAVGIGPGRHPSTEALSADVRQGLHDAVAAGAAQIKADTQQDVPQRRAEAQRLARRLAPAPTAPTTRPGRWSTHRARRAPAVPGHVPVHGDRPGSPPADRRQPLRRPRAGAVPPFPARAFWSLTLYDAHGFFVPNPAHVYLINNRSPGPRNADGSLDIYIQPNAPSNARQRRNWLPSPAGRAFRLIMRLYEPENIPGHPLRPHLAAADGAAVPAERDDLGRRRLRELSGASPVPEPPQPSRLRSFTIRGRPQLQPRRSPMGFDQYHEPPAELSPRGPDVRADVRVAHRGGRGDRLVRAADGGRDRRGGQGDHARTPSRRSSSTSRWTSSSCCAAPRPGGRSPRGSCSRTATSSSTARRPRRRRVDRHEQRTESTRRPDLEKARPAAYVERREARPSPRVLALARRPGSGGRW